MVYHGLPICLFDDAFSILEKKSGEWILFVIKRDQRESNPRKKMVMKQALQSNSSVSGFHVVSVLIPQALFLVPGASQQVDDQPCISEVHQAISYYILI